MMKKYKSMVVSIAVLFFLVIVTFGVIYKNNQVEVKHLSYNEFLSLAQSNNVSQVTLSNNDEIKLKLKNDVDGVYVTDNPRNPELKEYLLRLDINVFESDSQAISTLQTVFGVFICLSTFFVAFRLLRKQQSGNLMTLNISAVADEKKESVKFENIAGNIEAKESVEDLIDFIKNPEKYSNYGARIPRGVIFYGPPGTGKTLMARAIAGEAQVPFFAVSGSDFVQMYVGVGASRVRELFQKAREAKNAVIFIDEIDALGKKRSVNVAGGNEERDQTLNALLTEMSGFDENEGIVVIAATNRLDILDEALLRPSRFDRQIEIGLPDVSGREMILRLHSKNKPLSNEVDLKKLARQTVYFSGAMLENLLNEAAISVAKKQSLEITQNDIDKAYYTVIAGSEKKDKSSINDYDRQITAYHEAGHAIISKLVAPESVVSKVTIIPSTKGAGGFCINIPREKMYYSKKEIESQIMISLAGRVAEEIKFGADNITTGAANDIEKATAQIKDYVSKYGMSKNLGLLNIDTLLEGKNNSGFQKEYIDDCRNLMSLLYSKTKNLLKKNKNMWEDIACSLLEKETLNEDDVDAIFHNHKKTANINRPLLESITT